MAEGKNTETSIQSDMDGGWKDIIEDFTEDFFEFYFPDIHKRIDFSEGVKFLDKQLTQIISDGESVKRDADKLMEVRLKNGEVEWILIHIEVQSYPDKTFEERMYVYNYRIYDKYRRKVVSLAVLIDGDEHYRPSGFSFEDMGFKLVFEFPVVKIIDFEADNLIDDDNPFAIATRVQLRKIEDMGDDEGRYDHKVSLTRGLYEKGFGKEKIVKLYRFIDFVLTLPKPLAIKFKKEHEKIEEDLRMPYVTSNERLAREEQARDDVLEILEVRFKHIPYELKEKINYCDNVSKLKKLHRQALTIKTIDELNV